ncbi:MAG: hypothetical protein ACTSU6_08085 [Candidatus Njordarchaeales archaeon]
MSVLKIQPLTAWNILKDLPDQVEEKSLEQIARIYDLKPNQLKKYIDAFRQIGLIYENEHIMVKKPKDYAEFLELIVNWIKQNLEVDLMEIIRNFNEKGVSISDKTLFIALRKHGIKVTKSKLRSIMRLLRTSGLLIPIRTYVISEIPRNEEDLIKKIIKEHGVITYKELLNISNRYFNMTTEFVDKILVKLLENEIIDYDFSKDILELWKIMKSSVEDPPSAPPLSVRLTDISTLKKFRKKIEPLMKKYPDLVGTFINRRDGSQAIILRKLWRDDTQFMVI